MATTNRRWNTDRLSATALLRQAHQRVHGDIAQAIAILSGWSYDHWNARGAINVLRREAKNGHRAFRIDERAFVTGYTAITEPPLERPAS